jgi:hypothetical protein
VCRGIIIGHIDCPDSGAGADVKNFLGGSEAQRVSRSG